MVNQGFFSASRLNEEKNKANRFAGQKENTIARVDGPSTPIGSEYGLGSLNINRGATFPVNIRPKKGFTLDDVYGIKKSFVSPSGNEVGQITSSDLTNLRVGSPEVRLASIKSYIDSDTKPYAPDDVGDYIKESETQKRPTYGENLEKAIDNLSRFDKSFYGVTDKLKEYGVPMSDEEKRVTTAYTLSNPLNRSDSYKFSDTNYANIQADYDKYKDLRDRRETRKEAEETLAKFRSDYMKDFRDADYAIRMKQYNPDGTEKDTNIYNASLGEQVNNLRRVDEPGYTLDRFGNVRPQSDVDAYNKKVDAEEAERTRLSKLQARTNYEDLQKTILQRVGDFLGGAVNTAIGAVSAEGKTLDAQRAQEALNIASLIRDGSSVEKPGSNRSGTDTSATVNIGGRGGSRRSNTGSKSASRGTAGSRSRGGVSRGSSKSNTGSKSTARGARGSANSRSKGGTGSGRTSTSRTASKASKGRTGRSRTRCDIRTKINISPLINSNLVKDNLAEVAYFVQEIKK